MSTLLFGHDVAVAKWVGEQLGVLIVPPYTAIGVIDQSGTLIGGCIWNDYNGTNVEATIYGPGAMTRPVIRAMFHYAYVQLGCWRVSASTRRDNAEFRKVLQRLGFRFEGVSPRFYSRSKAGDRLRYWMPANECRWLDRKATAREFTQSAHRS